MSPAELAEHYVNETSVSIFLTGKAGTGKTTFLRHIVATSHKRLVVLAPTGVASVNAGGVTIHSFFQLPFCPFLPDVPELVTEYQLPGAKNKLRKSKVDIIRSLDLLIIDEISMVRADLLDAVDFMLRRYRRNSRPFGGVQLLLIGDVQQLSPVVTEDERPYIERVYPSPYFFCSKALNQLHYFTIQLTKVYRQQDPAFVRLLNNIRDNRFDADTLAMLNSRVRAADQSNEGPSPILLTTHVAQAERVNTSMLDALTGRQYEFKASVEGSFPESSLPADSPLKLKIGARVMFVKNDSSGEHKYYNGKVGTVTGVFENDDNVCVTVMDDDNETIVVGRERWESLKYEIDKGDGKIKQYIDGVCMQFPLRLAWAVTIHKAQGLTFDRVEVDAASAFAYGQVYVALSRCRTLEGLTLRTPIDPNAAICDVSVSNFISSFTPVEQLDSALDESRRAYWLNQVADLFDMSALCRSADRLNDIFQHRLRVIYPDKAAVMSSILSELYELQDVSARFKIQLARMQQQLLSDSSSCETHPAMLQRVRQAADYFYDKLDTLLGRYRPLTNLDIDNKEVRTAYKDWSESTEELFSLKCFCYKYVQEKGFSVDIYQQAKAYHLLHGDDKSHDKVAKQTKSNRRRDVGTAVTSGEANPDLLRLLVAWRKSEAEKIGRPAFVVMHQKTLLAIVAAMPVSEKQLLNVAGMGKKKVSQYGKAILDIIADFRETQGL